MQYGEVVCVRMLEEMSINAFPSLQTVLYDGWVLRFAGGYSNRANSVYPLYKSTINVHKKIDICEMLYKSKGLRPAFKITPFVVPGDLDDILESRGYETLHPTRVETLCLDELEEPGIRAITVFNGFDEKWFEYYCCSKSLSEKDRIILRNINMNIIPPKYYVLFKLGNANAGCGMAVLENGHAGIFDIFIAEEHRNKGYGRQLMLNILGIAKERGAKKAYLQVMNDNLPALRLYENLGFKEEYRYWYRVLD
jgi:ribosomal protein S18 acetylase RimI-like enzyme